LTVITWAVTLAASADVAAVRPAATKAKALSPMTHFRINAAPSTSIPADDLRPPRPAAAKTGIRRTAVCRMTAKIRDHFARPVGLVVLIAQPTARIPRRWHPFGGPGLLCSPRSSSC
jgi:hypothetical protein